MKERGGGKKGGRRKKGKELKRGERVVLGLDAVCTTKYPHPQELGKWGGGGDSCARATSKWEMQGGFLEAPPSEPQHTCNSRGASKKRGGGRDWTGGGGS